jgi:hypothetical protein
MVTKLSYPFRLSNAFFISLEFQRGPNVLPGVNLAVTVELKLATVGYPKQIQANIRLSTADGTPIKFCLELVGIFDYMGDDSEKDKNRIVEFLNNQGFIQLWPYLVQMTKIITSQMGMSPININIPENIYLDPKIMKLAASSKDEKSEQGLLPQ